MTYPSVPQGTCHRNFLGPEERSHDHHCHNCETSHTHQNGFTDRRYEPFRAEPSLGSTFSQAVTHGVMAAIPAVSGTLVALSAKATALKVTGVAMSLFGAYGLLGVIYCGIMHSNDPQGYRNNIHKFVTAIVGAGAAEILTSVAKAVLFDLVHDLIHGNKEKKE